MTSLKNPIGSPRVAIIGAGIGGLAFAIALKRQLGFENFIIYEKASEVGGTWRNNVYPGCSSDVLMHFYSLSTDLNPNWSTSHGLHDEIQAYWIQLAQKYALYKHIVFNRKVVSAEWDSIGQLYHITTEDTASGVLRSISAEILISAVGILDIPRFPDIMGLSTFKGARFHSAQWDKNIDLREKRVAVIGNGASATQFVPIITENPSVQVTQFCRTPNWFLPPIRRKYSKYEKWAFRNVPLFMRLTRFLVFVQAELLYFIVFSNSFFRRIMTNRARNYIMNTAPLKDRGRLVPEYALGCKRIIFDTNFLAALHRPNLSLNWDGISSIVEDGIITKKGENIPFDVMIFATGYVADKYSIPIHGSKPQTIQQYHESQSGPKAYLGTTIPGFPNFFVVSGPNTATGHTSVIYTEEVQIDYILQLIRPILARKVTSFEVTPDATDAYNDKISARLARSVFMGCFSWYRAGGDRRVTSIFPGSGTLFWWWLRRPDWKHYVAVGADEWKQQSRWERLARSFRWAAPFLVLLSVLHYLQVLPWKAA